MAQSVPFLVDFMPSSGVASQHKEYMLEREPMIGRNVALA